MPGFNFGQIGPILSRYMNIDKMDIGRREKIKNPNGTWGETDPGIPKYKDVPCHITFNTADNPDPGSIDTKPIIVSITIHCDELIDLQNNDFITARKMSHDGEVMETYTGNIGFPSVVQSRKRAQMAMQANV